MTADTIVVLVIVGVLAVVVVLAVVFSTRL